MMRTLVIRDIHGDLDNHTVYFGENRIIGINGGAVYGGQLIRLELPKKTFRKMIY